MKYLLDTHIVLWVAENSYFLSEKAKTAILDENNEKYVSIVSVWEVAIKLRTNKLHLDGGLQEFYRMIDDNGFLTLSIEREYLLLLEQLQFYHKDPFDRLLITTTLSENMTLISADENIHKYKIPCLW